MNSPELIPPAALDLLAQALDSLGPLEDEDRRAIGEHMRARRVKRREHFLRAGEVSTEVGFVAEGALCSTFERGGRERTGHIFLEGDFIAIMHSFLRGEPSRLGYVALEDSLLLTLERRELDALYDASARFERVGRRIVESLLVEREDRIESLLLDSPEKRYARLVRERADLIERIPQKALASYLGVTEVSLSRIKQRVFSPKQANASSRLNGPDAHSSDPAESDADAKSRSQNPREGF